MTKEVKFVSLAEFKAVTEGSGGFAGYVTKFGWLDDVADIILKGAYADTIAQFRKGGFNADTHRWIFGELAGYPVDAKEDEVGFFSEARFHSTPSAQASRTVAQERMAAGLDVFVSIGYEPSAPPILIEPKDYATEIPKYSAPGLAEQNLQKAVRFPMVRVLPKVHLYEWSLVPVPALESAMLSDVKSGALEQEQGAIERLNAVLEANVGDGLDDGLTYTKHLSAVVDAAKAITDRTEARASMRVKEGRVLSSANWSELQDLYDRLGKLLEAAKPKPKEEGDAEEGKALMAEANALILEHYARQQSLRALRLPNRS